MVNSDKAVPHLLLSLLGVETPPHRTVGSSSGLPGPISVPQPKREVTPLSPFLDEVTITVVLSSFSMATQLGDHRARPRI